jgi:hypothetical protein
MMQINLNQQNKPISVEHGRFSFRYEFPSFIEVQVFLEGIVSLEEFIAKSFTYVSQGFGELLYQPYYSSQKVVYPGSPNQTVGEPARKDWIVLLDQEPIRLEMILGR